MGGGGGSDDHQQVTSVPTACSEARGAIGEAGLPARCARGAAMHHASSPETSPGGETRPIEPLIEDNGRD